MPDGSTQVERTYTFEGDFAQMIAEIDRALTSDGWELEIREEEFRAYSRHSGYPDYADRLLIFGGMKALVWNGSEQAVMDKGWISVGLVVTETSLLQRAKRFVGLN